MGRIADGSVMKRDGRTRPRLSPSTRLEPIPARRSPSTGRGARHRRLSRVLLSLVGMGVVWRVVRFAGGQPLWGDEAFLAISLLLRDFAGLLRPLEYYQIAPVGFLWGERAIVRTLGPSEWSLRAIPFASGLASLGLFVGLARKTLDRRSALIAVGIFAASFYPVRHSAEVKPYATDLLFSLLTTGLAWSTWLDRESSRRWLGLAGVVSVGVWCSYPLVFVASGVGVVLAVRVARDPTRRSTALFLSFAVSALASWVGSYLAVARGQSKAAPFYTSLGTWRGAFPPLDEPAKMGYWLLDVHTGNMLAYPNGGNQFGSLATALLVAVGIVTMLRSRPALLAMLLAPLAPTLLAACLKLYPYGTSARTSLYMAPAFCLMAASGLVAIIRRFKGGRRRRVYWFSVLSLAGMTVGSTAADIAWPYKNWEDGENRRGVEALAGLARLGDRWVVYDGLEELPNSKSLMLEHWLQQMAEVRYNVLAKAPVPVDWMPKPGRVEVAEAGKTWLIVHRSRCPGFDEARLDALKADLASRLGPPRVRIDRLTRGESIEAFEYGASGGE